MADARLTEARRGRGKRLAKVAALACVALAFVAEPWVPAICPMRLLFHIPCPSCGLTRAARSLLHGDLVGATRFHPLWWAVFAYLGALAALEGVAYVRQGTFGRWTQHPLFQRAGMALVIALVVVWGAREAGALGGPVSLE